MSVPDVEVGLFRRGLECLELARIVHHFQVRIDRVLQTRNHTQGWLYASVQEGSNYNPLLTSRGEQNSAKAHPAVRGVKRARKATVPPNTLEALI